MMYVPIWISTVCPIAARNSRTCRAVILEMRFPNRSTETIFPISSSSCQTGIATERRIGSWTVGPKNVGGIPLLNHAAAGANTSRPSKVDPTVSKRYCGLLICHTFAPTSCSRTSVNNPLSGPIKNEPPDAPSRLRDRPRPHGWSVLGNSDSRTLESTQLLGSGGMRFGARDRRWRRRN
jgi:hypothetical protein